MKKKIISLVLAGAVAISVMACGSGNSDSSAASGTGTSEGTTASAETESSSAGADDLSGKITMWVWADISDEIDAYKAEHPNVDIEQVVIDAGDYVTKIQTTVASGGELPDLVWGEALNRGQIFDMGVLDVLTNDPYNFDDSTIEASVLPTMKNEDGEYVGIERDLNPSGLGYHRDLAKQYFGTDDPAELEKMFPTWDSLIEAGKKVEEESGGAVKMFSSLGDIYYMINGQAKTPRISKGVINKQATTDIFSTIAEFRDANLVGKIDQWTPAWYASFASEDAIFSPMPSYGESTWITPNEPDGEADWGLMVPPEGGFMWGGTCWGITKDSKNKELAWDFAKFDLFGKGADIRFDNGEIPSAAGYMTEEKTSKEDPYFGGQKVADMYINEILPTVTSQIPTKYDYSDISTIEVVLNSMNADYGVTAEDATNTYISEMQSQAPELTVQ